MKKLMEVAELTNKITLAKNHDKVITPSDKLKTGLQF